MAASRITDRSNFSFWRYFTDKAPPYGYNSRVFKALDYIGRFLSFSSKEKSTVEKWVSRALVYGSFGGLGLLGAACRIVASYSKNMKIEQPPAKTADPESPTTTTTQSTTDDKDFSLGVYTLNAALMTRLPFAKSSFINNDFLGENSKRAKSIAERILAMGADGPDIIQFQEVFDEAAEDIFRERFKTQYPYCVHGIGNSFLTAGSGLVCFSKYPILDAEFLPYDHNMLGEESLATKGALLLILNVNGKKVLSIGTHTQSGGGLFRSLSDPWAGTTGDRRDKQLGQLDEAIERILPLHPDLDLVVMSGDINVKVENLAKQHTFSKGQRAGVKPTALPKSAYLPDDPAPQFGTIKYPNIDKLMRRFNVIDPNLRRYQSTVEQEPMTELDKRLEQEHKGYQELKYTRGPFNYQEVNIHGKRSGIKWGERQKEVYDNKQDITIYTGTAVVKACLTNNLYKPEEKVPLADQGKIIDVNLVCSLKEKKAVDGTTETSVVGSDEKGHKFKLFKPSTEYQHQTIIHNVDGDSDHHGLFTKITAYGDTKGAASLLKIAGKEKLEVVADKKAEKELETALPPRSFVRRLGY